MAVNLSPIWGAGAQLLDNSGNVLSGGKIYTYAAGTTTQVTTYTSNTGVTTNSNPIVLNSAGRVPYEIWLTDGQNYKFVLKDSNDVLIGTWDNLSGINSNFIAYTNQQEIQTATAGQTVFNLTTMNYLVGTNSLSVFVDGVNQYGPGAQYAYEETDSSTVTFASGLHVGAEVKFTSSQIQNAGVADASQITYDPPFTGAVATNVEAKLSDTVSVKDFGAVGDGVTDDTAAIQNAINYAASIGGSVIYFPTAVYVAGMLTISGDNITLMGYGVTLKNTRFTFTSTSSNIKLEGFYVYDDTGINTRYFLEIQGNYLTIQDCKFEFINHLQALGWVRRNVSYLYFTRVHAIKGGLNIFGGGTDYHFTDCVWENGTDDAIAIKAPALDGNSFVTQNVTIQGGRVKNHAAIVSIGSDVGRSGADGYNAAVQNVTVTNVTATDTTSILFIKPGIISGSDWRDGQVQNVTVSNCTLTDTTGAKYKRAIDIQAGRGAIVNNVIVSNCAVYARCPAIVTDHAFVYLKTVAEGDSATIKNIFINDCSFIDIYDGAANAVGAPGYPTTQAVFGEQANGSIQNVVIDNCLMRGTRDSGIFCDIADLTVRNTSLQKIANNPVATFSGFWNGDNLTQYKNNNIEVLNGLAIGYISGSGGGDFDANTETSIVSLGSAAAGTDVSATSFVAPTDCYIWKIILVNTASIAQSNTDYLQIRFYNHDTAAYLIQTDTTLTGLNITGYTGVSVNGADAFTGANAYLPKGGILSFSTVNQGAGKPLTNMYAVVYYAPFGL